MKIVCLIGCRANPKGEEWLLGGYPLIMWSYTAACGSKYIGKNNTYISTNSSVLYKKLIDVVGKDHWISRPDALATDTATDLVWIQHALFSITLMGGAEPDLIIHLRASTPLTDPAVIDQAIELFLKTPDATSLRSAQKLNESPEKMFRKQGKYWQSFMPIDINQTNLPRQMYADCFWPNGYVDIVRPEVIDSGSLHGDRILAFETEPIIEVDTLHDLKENELHCKQSPLYKEIR